MGTASGKFLGIRPDNTNLFSTFLPPAKVQQPWATAPATLGHSIVVVVFALAADAQLGAGTITARLLAARQALCCAGHALLGNTLIPIVTGTRSVLEANTTHTHNVTATNTLTRIYDQHLELGANRRRFVDLPVTVVVVVITVDID